MMIMDLVSNYGCCDVPEKIVINLSWECGTEWRTFYLKSGQILTYMLLRVSSVNNE